MKQLVFFILKSNFHFLLMAVVFCFFAIEFGGVWNIIPTIFLVFFFYEYNVESQFNKTWTHLENLSISLFRKYLLKIVFPFLFSFAIIFSIELLKKSNEIEIAQALEVSLKHSSIFVLSSILSRSLVGYILYLIFFHLIMLKLSTFNFYMLCTLIFTFSYSYYFISQKKVSNKLFLHIPIFSIIFILVVGHYYYISIYRTLLSIPVKSSQLYSAQVLVNSFYKSYEQNEFDDLLIIKIEDIILNENRCTAVCFNLAKIMQTRFDKINIERLGNYLISINETKQIYALEIFRALNDVYYINRIIQLTQSNNINVANRALDVLNRWGISTPHDLPRTQTF